MIKTYYIRPVDLSGIGTECSFSDENGDYWKKLYKLLNVKIIKEVKSTIDSKNVLEYYNSGMIVHNRKKDLFQEWEHNFSKTMHSNLMPSKGIFFVEQSVFAATISSLELDVKILNKYYNCPVHLLDHEDNHSLKIDNFENIVNAHYHKIFVKNENPIYDRLNQFDQGKIINKKLREFKVLEKKSRILGKMREFLKF